MNKREELASYAHDAWSGWMKYMFSKSIITTDKNVIIPSDLVKRWDRQMNTKYEDLPESEKESDRKEADTMLAIIKGNVFYGSTIAYIDDKTDEE
jgi:hypothetical protein